MAGITGLGGVFLRSQDPQRLYSWYQEHLGLKAGEGGFLFAAEAQNGKLAVSFFPQASKYFPPSQAVMLNFQVDDLHAVLAKLEAAGVSVDAKRETYSYGHFGWFQDPDGNRVELWQPTS